MGIEKQIAGRKIYLDTNIFIYSFEGYPKYSHQLQSLFSIIDQGHYTAYTSELTLAELLVKPLAENRHFLADIYIESLSSIQGLCLIPVSLDVLINAAELRARLGSQVKLPDAIHLATAVQQECTSFVTNDKRLRVVNDITVVILDDLVAGAG